MSQHQEPTSRTLDILSALIAFPTVSRDSNLGLIEWVRDSLRRQRELGNLDDIQIRDALAVHERRHAR